MTNDFPHKLANAKADAKLLNAHHQRYASGFYPSFGGRYFKAREHEGKLQVAEWGDTWRDVPEGTTFHSTAYRPIYMTV